MPLKSKAFKQNPQIRNKKKNKVDQSELDKSNISLSQASSIQYLNIYESVGGGLGKNRYKVNSNYNNSNNVSLHNKAVDDSS